MNCYKSLAEFYDKLNSDCDYNKWSQYLLGLLKANGINSGNGCDMACGSGIITNKLAEYGFSMIGMDISSEMLERAYQTKCAATKFILGDLRDFTLTKKQDFINVTCDGVNYLNFGVGEFDKFLSAAYDNLAENGMLMFDISSIWKFKNILGNNIFADDTDDVTYIWQNDLSKKYIDMSFIIFTRDGDKYYKNYEEHRMYLYENNYIIKKLEEHGFKEVRAYDAFTQNEPHTSSQRIQYVAIKR